MLVCVWLSSMKLVEAKVRKTYEGVSKIWEAKKR